MNEQLTFRVLPTKAPESLANNNQKKCIQTLFSEVYRRIISTIHVIKWNSPCGGWTARGWSSAYLCRSSARPQWSRLCTGWTGWTETMSRCWRPPVGWRPQEGRGLAPFAGRCPGRKRCRRSLEGRGIRQSGWYTAFPLYRHHLSTHTHQYLRKNGEKKPTLYN